MFLPDRDGTAKGGDKLTTGIDYKRTEGVLTFLHNESSKVVVIDVNKDAQVIWRFFYISRQNLTYCCDNSLVYIPVLFWVIFDIYAILHCYLL